MKNLKKYISIFGLAVILAISVPTLGSALEIEEEAVSTQVETEQVSVIVERLNDEGEIQLTVTNNTEDVMHNLNVQSLPIEGLTLKSNDLTIDELGPNESTVIKVDYSEIEEEVVIPDDDSDVIIGNDTKEPTADDKVVTDVEKTEKTPEEGFHTSDNSGMSVPYIGLVLISGAGFVYLMVRKKKTSKVIAVILTSGLILSATPVGTSAVEAEFDINDVKASVEANGPELHTLNLATDDKIILLGDLEYKYEFTITYETDIVEYVMDVNEEVLPAIEIEATLDDSVNVVILDDNGKYTQSKELTDGLFTTKSVVKYLNGKVVESWNPVLVEELVEDAVHIIGAKDVVVEFDVDEDTLEPGTYITKTTYSLDKDNEVMITNEGFEIESHNYTTTYLPVENTQEATTVVEGLNKITSKTFVGDIYGDEIVLQEMIEEVREVGNIGIVEKDIDFETEIKVDNNKDYGYKNVDIEGEKGINQVTTYYIVDKDSGELIVDEDRPAIEEVTKEPVTKVKSLGTKDIRVKDIDFKTIYIPDTTMNIEDDNIESGGVKGKLQETYYYKLVDGKLSDPQKDDSVDTVLSEPVTKEIRVGVKEVVVEVIKPDIKYEVDNSLPANTQNEVKGTDGSVTSTYHYSLDDNGVRSNKTLFEKETVNAIDTVITVGTRYTEDTVIDRNVVYQADDSLNANETEVINEGNDGTLTKTFNYNVDADGNLLDAELVNTEITVEPSDKVINVGTKRVKETVIERNVVYQENRGLAFNEQNIIEEGNDGLLVEVFNSKVNDSGNLIDEELTSSDITIAPNQKLIEVGTKIVEEEIIEFETVTEYDDTRWDIFEDITQDGVDGLITRTYQAVLDEVTGVADASQKVLIDTKTLEAQNKINTIGTKVPETVINDVNTIVDEYTSTTRDFVSSEDVALMSSEDDAIDKNNEFNDHISDLVEKEGVNGSYVELAGVDGVKVETEAVRVDENGDAVPGYAVIKSTRVDSVRTDEELVKLGFTHAVETQNYTVSYVANPDLEFDVRNIVDKGENGKVFVVTHDSGVTHEVILNELQNELVEVGTQKLLGERIIPSEKKGTLVMDPWRQMGDENKIFGTEFEHAAHYYEDGVDGIAIVTENYEIDSNGNLVNPVETIEVIDEAVHQVKVIPGNKYSGGTFSQSEADELLRLINEYRAEQSTEEKPLHPFVKPAQNLTEIQAFANMRNALHGAGVPLYHVGDYDNNLGQWFNSPQAMLEGWIQSPGHNANLLREDATTAIVSSYNGPQGRYWTLGLDPEYTYANEFTTGYVWDMDYILRTFK